MHLEWEGFCRCKANLKLPWSSLLLRILICYNRARDALESMSLSTSQVIYPTQKESGELWSGRIRKREKKNSFDNPSENAGFDFRAHMPSLRLVTPFLRQKSTALCVHDKRDGGWPLWQTLFQHYWVLTLSRPGKLDHPSDIFGILSFDVPIFFFNVPELSRVS